MKLESEQDVYLHAIRDTLSAERQLIKALPKLAAAAGESLKSAFESHLEETREQVTRLEAILKSLGQGAGRVKCKGMEAIIAEGEETLGKEPAESIRDTVLIAGAQKVEHYETSAYESLILLATKLGRTEDLEALRATLEEERNTSRSLTRLAGGTPEDATGSQDASDSTDTTESTTSTQNAQRAATPARPRAASAGGTNTLAGGATPGSHALNSERSSGMGRYDEDRYDDDRRSGRSRYDEDYSGRRSSRSSDYDDDRGSYEGRSRGGYNSARSQERDEYGQFAGSSGGGGRRSSRDDDDDDDRGGRSRSSSSSRGSSGRSSRNDDDDDRGGRSRSRSNGGSSSRSSSNSGGGGGGGRGYTDSAGRHYSRESWERAQRGRALGGQHSHGGR
ncbi:MAG: DUF892 family protein [Planctomycetota bacterium]|nr:DUF892 family protein [Planctomycetota bacterium]